MSHEETHKSNRIGWLRAAVMGANDGIVSTASLIIGVAAANANQQTIVLAGLAGLVAGAMSMAAGEYVSVSSQSDAEAADLDMERRSLEDDLEDETDELAKIYETRGLEPDLARRVAEQLMDHDALDAHARDEIGITATWAPRPVQAALSSAATFAIGALLPLGAATLVTGPQQLVAIALATLIFLAALGAVAAKAGGAPALTGAARVTFWGALAMAATAAVGHLFGVIA